MNLAYRIGVALLCCVCLPSFGQSAPGSALLAKSETTAEPQPASRLSLNVVITDKSGNPVRGLEAKDFELLDNKQPQKVLSLESASEQGATPVTEIMLVLDEVNTSYALAGFEREGVSRFLRQNGGKMPYPVTFAYFSSHGLSMMNGASTDGNALANAFEQHETAVRSANQLTTSYGALEQFQRSLTTLNTLVATEGKKPGRKLMIWFSPGWPLMAGANVDLDKKEQDGLFAAIVATSNALRQSGVTLYSIDPVGMAGANSFGASAYLSFLKPVQEAKQTEIGNLALQVLATHSGGLVLHSSNDIAGEIERCVADANASYTLTAERPAADHPNQYHAIELKAQTPGLVVRTLKGYYAQP